MSTILESVPYDYFLDLREEVHEVHAALNLVLSILGGLAGLTDEQISEELYKELNKNGNRRRIIQSISDHSNEPFSRDPLKLSTDCEEKGRTIEEAPVIVIPNVVEDTSSSCNSTNDCRRGIKEQQSVIKPVDISTLLSDNTGILSRNVIERQQENDCSSVISKEKPVITPVDISSLLRHADVVSTDTPSTSLQSTNCLSVINRDSIETNDLRHGLDTDKILIDIETLAVKQPANIEIPLSDSDISPEELFDESSVSTDEKWPSRERKRKNQWASFTSRDSQSPGDHEIPRILLKGKEPNRTFLKAGKECLQKIQFSSSNDEKDDIHVCGGNLDNILGMKRPLRRNTEEDKRCIDVHEKRRFQGQQSARRFRQRKKKKLQELKVIHKQLELKNTRLHSKMMLLKQARDLVLSVIGGNSVDVLLHYSPRKI